VRVLCELKFADGTYRRLRTSYEEVVTSMQAGLMFEVTTHRGDVLLVNPAYVAVVKRVAR
jgi:hypothetical protein